MKYDKERAKLNDMVNKLESLGLDEIEVSQKIMKDIEIQIGKMSEFLTDLTRSVKKP
jgi:hypothetical protein